MHLGSQQHLRYSRDTSLAETWWVLVHDLCLAGSSRSMSLAPGMNKCYSQRLQDLSDVQWRGFRQGLPLLAVLFGTFAAVSNLVSHQSWNSLAAKLSSADSAALYCSAADRMSAPCCSCRNGFHRAGRPSSL